MRDQIIVECFGVPGVGKTYVASQICQMLEAEGISVNDFAMIIGRASSYSRIIRKSRLIIGSTAKNLSVLKIVFRMVNLHRPKKLRYWLKLIVNWLYVRALIANQSQSDEVRVLDQGVGQAIWSTRFYGKEAPKHEVVVGALMEFLERLPIAALVIVSIDAPDKVVLERLRNRRDGQSPLDKDEGLWDLASEVTGATKCVLEYLASDSGRVSLSEYRNHQSAGERDCNPLSNALAAVKGARGSHAA